MAAGSLEDTLKQSWDDKLVANPNERVQQHMKFRQTYLGMFQPMTSPTEREKQAVAMRKPDTKVIPMTAGMPDANLLPYDELMEFARATWERSHPAPLQYGSSELLKAEIAKYLTRTRGNKVEPNEIYISSGNSSGLVNVMQAYLGPGDIAIVESPLWTITVNFMKQTGADVWCVGLDSEGILLDELEQLILKAERDGKRIKLLYVQPIHHNPTGVTISLARAERLLRLAAKHSIIIVCDEPYEMYYYGSQPPPYLSKLSGGFGVLSVHTFSKTLGTGLRIGFVHSRPEWLAPMQAIISLNASVFWEYTVGELMASGRYEQIIARAKSVYTKKMKAFCEALQVHGGRHLASPPNPTGGFFVWLELASLSADEVYLQLLNLGVATRVGKNMYGPGHIEISHDGVAKPCHIGFSFVGPSEEDLVEAGRRFGAACDAVEAAKGSARL